MVPYASLLGGDDPLESIGTTVTRLRVALDKLGPEARRRPAPGKWSAAEIVSHLADTELVFGVRLRQALAMENHVVQPFDQDAWAKNYESLDEREALDVFSAVRRWNIAFIEKAKPEDFERKLTHPERGEMTFRNLVETMAGHDRNHLLQLEKMASNS